MNHHITLFLFALGIALVTSAPTSTPKSPQELSQQVYSINKQIDSLTRAFEIAVADSASADKKVALSSVLSDAKQLSANISTVQFDLGQAVYHMSYINPHAFSERLRLEFSLIEVNAKARQLRTVQLEVLGITNGVSHLPNYRFSERITLTADYLGDRFDEGFAKLKEVDVLLEKAKNASTHAGGENHYHSMDAKTKEKIVKLLKDFITQTSAFKKDIEVQYYRVLEEMRLKGEELELTLRFIFEGAIDYVNISLAFAGQNLEFIEKFASHSLLLMFDSFV